jgi:hypothetical protein
MPSCANVTGSDTSVCCDHTPGCCDTGEGRFELLPSNPQPFAVWDETESRFVKVSSTTTSTSTTSATSSTSATGSETTLPPTQATTNGSLPPQPSNQDPDQDSNQPESPGLSVGVQAGIGVGVSIVGILLGVIAWLLWKLYQSKKATNHHHQPGPQDGYHYETQEYPPTASESLYMESVPQEMFTPPSELYTDPPYSELYGSSKAVEAPGRVSMYR